MNVLRLILAARSASIIRATIRRLPTVAKDFHRSVPDIAFTITATLAMRPVGALIFGWAADRYGRRRPLMIDVIFYSIVEVLSGLAPSYGWFLFFRALYGVGMGGE